MTAEAVTSNDVASIAKKRSAKTSAQSAAAGVMDDIIHSVTVEYLDEIDPANTGLPLPDQTTIKRELLDRTNRKFQINNGDRKGHDRMTLLKMLSFTHIAHLLIRFHRVVRIAPSLKSTDPDNDMLGIYVDEGEDEGIYVTSEAQLRGIARQYNREMTIAGAKEMFNVLRETAPRVVRCRDQDLVPVNNGIFNYRTKELLPFDPDLIFLSKARVDLDYTATSPVIVNPDGTEWEVEQWMAGLSDDPDLVNLLWQILGAVVRPLVRWHKTAWLYSEVGNNGKGTLCELMRNLVGEASCASIPLSEFGHEFKLEPLARASAVIVDENDVGVYLDKVANLKAVVTNDVIMVNRKHKQPINVQFFGFMVQCLNGFPQSKDRSESFYRRQLFVPFEKSYTGIERKYIKKDYLRRTEVLQYVLKRVLVDMPDYYELDEPEATKRVQNEYKEANDPVRQFWIEHEDVFVWDLLPFSFLFDCYKGWFAKTNPSGKPLGRNTFIRDLLQVVRQSTSWYCSDKEAKIRTGNRLNVPELLIIRYDLVDWMNQHYSGNDPRRRAQPALAPTYRGLQRYTSAAPSDDDTAISNDSA